MRSRIYSEVVGTGLRHKQINLKWPIRSANQRVVELVPGVRVITNHSALYGEPERPTQGGTIMRVTALHETRVQILVYLCLFTL